MDDKCCEEGFMSFNDGLMRAINLNEKIIVTNLFIITMMSIVVNDLLFTLLIEVFHRDRSIECKEQYN